MAARSKSATPFWRREGFGSRVYLVVVVFIVAALALHALQDAPRSWRVAGVSAPDAARIVYGALNRSYNWLKDAALAVIFTALFLAALSVAVLLILKWPIAFWAAQYHRWLAGRTVAHFALVVVLLSVAFRLFARIAVSLWFVSPLAFEYNTIRLDYGEHCTIAVQDDSYGSSHTESDWSRSPSLCRSLARKAYNDYSRPS